MSEKIKVTERALLARVNRRLAADGESLKVCRHDSRWFGELGRYYGINPGTNFVTSKHVDLERWARELGALRDWEELSKDD